MSDATPAATPSPQGAPPPYRIQQHGVPGASPDPLATALLSPWGHLVVFLLAVVGIVVNVSGGANFPSNAPVEWIMNAGITIDLVAVAIACGIGVRVARGRRLARPARVFPWLGLGLGIVAVVTWAVSSSGLWETLFLGGRGRYMNDVAGAFLFGIAWALGAIFSAYGVRGNTRPHLNVVSAFGIVLWAVVLVGVLASAVLYGLDLTD